MYNYSTFCTTSCNYKANLISVKSSRPFSNMIFNILNITHHKLYYHDFEFIYHLQYHLCYDFV